MSAHGVATAVLPDIALQFPVLSRRIGGKPLTYLDSAATSQTPQPVIDAMTSYYTESRASIHRGVYPLAVEATDLYEGARRRIAEWLGSTPEETIFSANATAAINLVAYTWGRQNVHRGDLVVLTEMEHHSNIVPWQLLCQDREAELAYVPVLDDGQLDLDALDELLARGPKLMAVVHVSNVLGTVNPVAEIVRRAHAVGAVVVIDGTQAIPQMPVDLRAIDADFYAWTGHKAYGPTGIGVLHGRRALLEEMPPFIGGGHMIRTVAANESTWTDLPWKFEAGTSQIAEAIGLGAAVDWLRALG
ncbi:MAG: aminotransferase class V-fold PLP-dependent enzyme, partial [Solirubrobacteraceae bacterium]